MDGALMGVPFSSLPVCGLTKMVSSGWPCFSLPHPRFFLGELFFSSPLALAQVSPTHLHLGYPPMHPGLLPAPPSYSSRSYLPTAHPTTYLSTHLPTYLCTYTLNFHQGNDNTGWLGYCNIQGKLFHHPSYLLSRPATLQPLKTMLQWPKWRYCN